MEVKGLSGLKKKKVECTQHTNEKLITVDSGKKKKKKKWIDFSATGVSHTVFIDTPVKGRRNRRGKKCRLVGGKLVCSH